MGLDMYLYRESYVKNWNHMKPEDRHEVTVRLGGKVRKDIKPKRVSMITEEVMYWRKANAIHRWFTDECADGLDECQPIYVSTKKLTELRDKCGEVIKAAEMLEGRILRSTTYSQGGVAHNYEDGMVMPNPAIARKILPTSEGFFFGSTEYDEYYIEDLKYTYQNLDELLREEEALGELFGSTFRYQASW